MSLKEFMDAQAKNAETFGQAQHFASLIPLMERMYRTATAAVQTLPKYSLTLLKLQILCEREFLVAASQIQRGLPFDSHANTRRAVEIAKLALALKRKLANAEEWLKTDLRQKKWDARQKGRKPPHLPPVRFPELDNEPLIEALQNYFGVASDMYLHFTPEYFGRQPFSQIPLQDEMVFIHLEFFAEERDILMHATFLCGLHVRILLVFDAVFENVITNDPGWNILRATFDQFAAELMRTLPPLEESLPANAGPPA